MNKQEVIKTLDKYIDMIKDLIEDLRTRQDLGLLCLDAGRIDGIKTGLVALYSVLDYDLMCDPAIESAYQFIQYTLNNEAFSIYKARLHELY